MSDQKITPIRGATQIKDKSIPLGKLTQDLQDRLTAATQRIDLLGVEGATFLPIRALTRP